MYMDSPVRRYRIVEYQTCIFVEIGGVLLYVLFGVAKLLHMLYQASTSEVERSPIGPRAHVIFR